MTLAGHLGILGPMDQPSGMPETQAFLKSLGFPDLRVHRSFNHFDFTRPARRILVIGSMGSGKTEFSARLWRDAEVACRKTGEAAEKARTGAADRRRVFFLRSSLDAGRFPDYPADALPFRGGHVRCGDRIAEIRDSFGLERILEANPQVGTWIIDEAAFYEERLAYVVEAASRSRGLNFVFPSLILNFRKEIFNTTARLLLDTATDVFPLTAYCEHPQCIEDSFYTYRSYRVDGRECPAPYFDPLVIIGGDRLAADPREPDYCTRCDGHHYLPGKEYTFLILKPLGERAQAGDEAPLREELSLIRTDIRRSRLHANFTELYADPVMRDALRVPCMAEKALLYLFTEQNLLSKERFRALAEDLGMDRGYLARRLADNRRPGILERP